MISIIVPIFNADKFLRRCIDSILDQNYTDFELLLVDDGSSDNSGNICDEYAAKDTRVRVFHKKNGGVSSARNLGLDNAKGEYITFCDADDYVTCDWLATYTDSMAERIDLSIQGYYIIDNGKIIEKTLSKEQGDTLGAIRKLIVALMSLGVYGYLWVKLFRRQIIEDYHIRFDEKSAFREDEQFFSKYLEYVTTFRCLDKESYYYILPPSNRAYYTSHSIGYTSCQTLLSLNRIFGNDIPQWILEKEFVYVKDFFAEKIADGKSLCPSEMELYNLMVTQLGYTRSLKFKLLNTLISKSYQIPNLSKVLIKIIRFIGRFF